MTEELKERIEEVLELLIPISEELEQLADGDNLLCMIEEFSDEAKRFIE